MGRKSLTGGVCAKGPDRIEFTFRYRGKRYRPTLAREPTEANLRRARVQLATIKANIKAGTFSFLEEFPDYRYQNELDEVKRQHAKQLTCNDVFDAFIAHCKMRMTMTDMAYSTLEGYQKILDSVWRPRIGKEAFEDVVYSRLASIAASHTIQKRTYNNIVSVLRCAFNFGYKDHPEKHNPASGLNTLRITKKDRVPIDPFTIQEGERIIAESHTEFGVAHGNYEEFRFFTGLRPSEQIALTVQDCDLVKGRIQVTKARVHGRDKDRTKTREDREIRLSGRALEVLQRQLVWRDRLVQAGRIDHEFVFFRGCGLPIFSLSYPYGRWRYVMEKTKVRYREPYNARHSYISWRLMTGTNLLLVAKEDGHSPQTMLSTYAAWTEDATQADVETIRKAMEHSPHVLPLCADGSPTNPLGDPGLATNSPPEGEWGRLSWRKYLQRNVGRGRDLR